MEHDRPLHTFRGYLVRLPAPVPEHRPMQPSWTCANCAEQWPCEPAREGMRAELDPTQLAMLMATYLEDFARDIGHGPLVGAFQRFIGWTRSAEGG